jgi:Flp pilus assembly protein TadG
MVEFTLVAPVLFLFIFGIIDFGRYYVAHSSVIEASRAGARYAAVHPTRWSNTSPPASDSIQGTIWSGAPSERFTNDNSHIQIRYFKLVGSSKTLCGGYDASTNTFAAQSGYTQATCLTQGSLVQVTVNQPFTLVTPLLQGFGITNLTITSTTELLEEQVT